MSVTRSMVTVLPTNIAPTTVGIAWEYHPSNPKADLVFFVMCPACDGTGFLTYLNGTDPMMVCSECPSKPTEFPGIPSEGLRHKGPRFQVWQVASKTLDIVHIHEIEEWIELWTGLTNVDLSITL